LSIPLSSAVAYHMQMDWSAVAIVVATIMGPILAVQAQKYLERHRDQTRAKDSLFRVLMATRANRIATEHVQALNGIELAFYGGGQKEKKVREAWKAYLDNLNDLKSYKPNRIPEWQTRQFDLFVDLPHDMAICLGYNDFDKTHIKNSWYAPEAHGTIEQQWNDIRAALADILTGKRYLPVGSSGASDEEVKETSELRKLLIEWLKMNTQIAQADEAATTKTGLLRKAAERVWDPAHDGVQKP
jgi:hypothetical protein